VLCGLRCAQVHSKFVDWESLDQALPAFLTLTLIPLTYSIAVGMTFGLAAFFILYIVQYVFRVLFKQPPPLPLGVGLCLHPHLVLSASLPLHCCCSHALTLICRLSADPMPQIPRSPFTKPLPDRRLSLSHRLSNFQLGGEPASAGGAYGGVATNDDL
jgi:hypothetical protein